MAVLTGIPALCRIGQVSRARDISNASPRTVSAAREQASLVREEVFSSHAAG